jgi:hypothetical protein
MEVQNYTFLNGSFYCISCHGFSPLMVEAVINRHIGQMVTKFEEKIKQVGWKCELMQAENKKHIAEIAKQVEAVEAIRDTLKIEIGNIVDGAISAENAKFAGAVERVEANQLLAEESKEYFTGNENPTPEQNEELWAILEKIGIVDIKRKCVPQIGQINQCDVCWSTIDLKKYSCGFIDIYQTAQSYYFGNHGHKLTISNNQIGNQIETYCRTDYFFVFEKNNKNPYKRGKYDTNTHFKTKYYKSDI